MGYNLYIGEFDVEVEHEDRRVSATVRIEDPIGPLNSSDRRDNQCWPSYTAWRNFADEVGLVEVFFGDGRKVPYFDAGPDHGSIFGLLCHHPGCVELLPAHRHAFYEAKLAYEKRPEHEQDEYVRLRLEWLTWWSDWALKNCEYPSFANT